MNQYFIGSTLGDPIASAPSLHSSGLVYYVSSVLGDSGNSGLSKQDPIDTLANAFGLSGMADAVIVLASDHVEPASALAFPAGVTVIGTGYSSGVPTSTLTGHTSSFTFGAGSQLRYVKVLPPATDSASPIMSIANAGVRLADVHADCDETHNAGCIQLSTGANDATLERLTLKSTATRNSTASLNDPPTTAIEITGALARVTLRDVTLDGGAIGWSGYALKADAAACTNLRVENLSRLNGAQSVINASTTGFVTAGTSTLGAGGVW